MKLAVDVKISKWAWGDGDESHALAATLDDTATTNRTTYTSELTGQTV